GAIASTPAPTGEGEANQIGAAEIQVGQYVYRRIEKLMGAEADTADGRGLDYLADLVANVEKHGARGDENGPQYKSRHFAAPATPARDGLEDEDRAAIERLEEFARTTAQGAYP